ncbi:MAG: competence/damage-inducible protein A [Candidatus Caenarcaniphilales bacterium]|nr:competence/damage-inducible protein A [Candidatus Caenarcaniphilales bacterium]
MRAEILSIGTELLLGEIINTNTAFLGQELAALGIDCYFQTTVGDNPERLKSVFRQALSRADLILCTGGLGPTPDDLTTKTWADFFEAPLFFDESVFEQIKKLFQSRGLPMPDSNRKQAQRPKGALLLPNPVGSAPGMIWEVTDLCLERKIGTAERKFVLTFPGVPGELYAMWQGSALPFLTSLEETGRKVLLQRDLRFYGIGESAMAEKVADLLNLADPTVASYASRAECRLRLATKASTEQEALSKLDQLEKEIAGRFGELLYTSHHPNLESTVAELLREQKITIAIAESCTGGWLSQRLTEIPGSSQYTKLNLVTYSNQAKEKMLGVSSDILKSHGAVSAETAKAMAEGIRRLAQTDLGISITGIAGPEGGSAEKPVGLVYFGIATNSDTKTYRQIWRNQSRSDIRWKATQEALNLIRLELLFDRMGIKFHLPI